MVTLSGSSGIVPWRSKSKFCHPCHSSGKPRKLSNPSNFMLGRYLAMIVRVVPENTPSSMKEPLGCAFDRAYFIIAVVS